MYCLMFCVCWDEECWQGWSVVGVIGELEYLKIENKEVFLRCFQEQSGYESDWQFCYLRREMLGIVIVYVMRKLYNVGLFGFFLFKFCLEVRKVRYEGQEVVIVRIWICIES